MKILLHIIFKGVWDFKLFTYIKADQLYRKKNPIIKKEFLCEVIL